MPSFTEALEELRGRIKSHKEIIFFLAVIAGISARFILMTFGHNYDFESYKIVGKLVYEGINVYANTNRYNYGPLFLFIQGLFYTIGFHFGDGEWLFRALIVCLLTWADVGITFLLKREYGTLSAFLFFLSPISVIITGYHNQFDNLSVLLMLLAVYFAEQGKDSQIQVNDLLFIIFFSLSLIMKHIFAFFIVWIFFSKQLPLRKKALYICIPVIAFLVSFALYCRTDIEAWNGVLNNVFQYASFNNAPLYGKVLELIGIPKEKYKVVFVIIMVVAGFLFRNYDLNEQILLYTICMVAFSSAIANQYLAIPVAALAVLGHKISLLYNFVGFIYLLASGDGLALNRVATAFPTIFGNQQNSYRIECFILAVFVILTFIKGEKNIGKSQPENL